MPRPRLSRRLQGAGERIVTVCAPAGFGKTVAVRDWMETVSAPRAWLSVDTGDGEPRRLYAMLGRALARMDTAEAQAAGALATALAEGREDVEEGDWLRALEGMAPESLLVLDDLDRLEGTESLKTLAAWFEALRGGPRFVLVSRTEPPVPTGRLRVSGDLSEVGPRELRFTRSEAEDLFRGFFPEPMAVALGGPVWEQVEGWPAGLSLALTALASAADPMEALEDFSGRHRFVADYLLEEVLRAQPPEMQTFLLETSILPRFTSNTCAAVTGDPDAPRLLRTAIRNNLFLVSLDDADLWHRYHHFFAELLQARLEATGSARLDELHARASAWFESQGDADQAMDHAVRMTTSDRLVDLLDIHGWPMVARTDLGTFGHWLDKVHRPLSFDRPMFLASVAWYRVLTDRAPNLDPVLKALDRALDHLDPGYPETRAREAALHGGIVRAFALRLAFRTHECIDLSEQLLDELPFDATVARGIVLFNLACARNRLCDMSEAVEMFHGSVEENLRAGTTGLVLISSGYLGGAILNTEGVPAALDALRAAVRSAEERRLAALPAFGFVLLHLGIALAVADELGEAATTLDEALRLGEEGAEPELEANALVQRARVHRARGRIQEARELLDYVAAMEQHQVRNLMGTTLEVERAVLRDMDPSSPWTPLKEGATRWTPGEEGWTSTEETVLATRLRRLIRRHLLGEDTLEAARDFQRRLEEETRGRGRGVAWCASRFAAALLSTDDETRFGILGEVLAFAAPRLYRRPILEFGAPARALLEAGLARGMDPVARLFASDLLVRLRDAGEPHLAEAVGLVEPLTDREAEALAHLAAERSNKAIARAMYVSTNTVKTHLKNLYGKLGASSRTDAVDRARELGLLDEPRA